MKALSSVDLTLWTPRQADHFPDYRNRSPLLTWDDPAAENDPDQ